MFDDPRWGDDPRDRGEDPRDRDRDDDWREPGHSRDVGAGDDHGSAHHSYDPRQHDEGDRVRDDDARELGGGHSSNRDDKAELDPRAREDERWPDRHCDPRHLEPRDALMRNIHLPRGRDREVVYDTRDREYTLRGSETRTLSTVGAFRVVPARDLRGHGDRPADPRNGDLRHLREQGLIETVRLPGHRDMAVVLTDRGRDLLESHRDRGHDHPQTFYSGLRRERELEHDSQIYAAYLSVADRLAERDARVNYVVLDYELKREYQQWLHEHDRDRDDYDGHPDRDEREIEAWALEHDLPYFDEQVHFPDLRIEYVEIDGRRNHENVEVLTVHYRGAHGAAATRSGFSCYSGLSARIGGRSGGGRRGGRNGGLAEEFLK